MSQMDSSRQLSAPSRRLLPVAMLIALMSPAAALAGNISLAWDAVPDADLASYRVFVGSSPGSGDQAILDVGRATSTLVTGLPDCAQLHVAVKAVDLAGNVSDSFSNFVTGMTQPRVTSVLPNQLNQGDENITMQIQGASFNAGMDRTGLEFDDLDVRVLGLNYLSCNTIEVEVSVGPFFASPGDPGYNGAGGVVEEVSPAEIGARGVSLAVPDGFGNAVTGGAPAVLTVDFAPDRTDTDGNGRVDGFDLARLARAFGTTRAPGSDYDPAVDLDGDKSVDGLDLTILADYFTLAF